MNPFRYAKNFFSDDFLPQQVILAIAILLLSIVLVMAGLVLIRRAFGPPRHSSSGTRPPPGLASFERYEIGARLWHIGLVGILGALVISGAAFFAPGIIPGPVPVLGLTWLFVHLFYLNGLQNRLFVFMRWTFSFVTHGRGARLPGSFTVLGDS